MKAIIFSAGLGTRFKPWTDKHPKALAVVRGKTLLQHNIEYLQRYGIVDVVVNVHHFADQIKNAIKDASGWGSNIVISDETDAVLETGGGLLKARQFLQDANSFLSLNVDVLTDLNIQHLINTYERTQALVCFAASKRKSSRNFLINNHNELTGWRNNTTGEEKRIGQNENAEPVAYSCVSVYSPDIFDKIELSGKFSMVEAFLQLAQNNKIIAHLHSGDKWVDVGRPESVAVAEEMFG